MQSQAECRRSRGKLWPRWFSNSAQGFDDVFCLELNFVADQIIRVELCC